MRAYGCLHLNSSKVEVQFPHVSDALLEQLGYQKKNRYSSSSFKVRTNSSFLYCSQENEPVAHKYDVVPHIMPQ